ncbi:PEP-CTERM sorting domain-containing protein [Massilia sp. W12]|uniref:PEP-CTERM sorting domain-containing protein n=1 Tax=Massilia sp. W12 TaxID=3126507 RepID=UPI0030D35370
MTKPFHFQKISSSLFKYALGAALAVSALASHAAAVQNGNLLVSDLSNGKLREMGQDGRTVQVFDTPDFADGFHSLRGVAMGEKGVVHMFNGTFTPRMTSLDSNNGSIKSNLGMNGWSTVNNISYGGIGVYGNSVFVSDMFTYSGGEASGIVMFNLKNGESSRFATNRSYTDLTVGRNGLLYALNGNVDVYDPNSLRLLKTINLSGNYDARGVAVDRSGNLFAVDMYGGLAQYDAQGALKKQINFGGFMTDIDVNDQGMLAIADRSSNISLLNSNLELVQRHSLSYRDSPYHLAFVQTPVPEAETWAMLGAGLSGLIALARRRRQQA